MSIFCKIDSNLKKFSQEIDARLTIDREGSIGEFEERRIDWEKDNLRKAIIIQPKFEKPGVVQNLWSFRVVAWKEPLAQFAFTENILSNRNFLDIEKNIDDLLEKGLSILTNIKETDLRKRFD